MELLLGLMPDVRLREWIITAEGIQPLTGGYFLFFEAETSTPAEVFANSDGSVSLGVQVDAEADGRFPTIYLSATMGYKVQLFDAEDAQIWEQDHVWVQGAGGGTSNNGGVQAVTTLGAGDNNDVTLDDGVTLMPMDPTAGAAFLTGVTGGVSNRRVVLINVSATLNYFQILQEDLDSAAENRFAGGSIAINPGQGIQIAYYGSRWYPIS